MSATNVVLPPYVHVTPKDFVRTKMPRMHRFHSESMEYGFLYIPMDDANLQNIIDAYTFVSPVFSSELPQKLKSEGYSKQGLFLNSLFLNHPGQRMGREKNWELGYEIQLRRDSGIRADKEYGHALVITYPMYCDYKQLLAIVKAVCIVEQNTPPIQFYCFSNEQGSVIASFSVSLTSSVVIDLETDVFGYERLGYENDMLCYMAHLLVVDKDHPNIKIPLKKFFKAPRSEDPESHLVDEMSLDYPDSTWVRSVKGFSISESHQVKLVRIEKVPAYTFEMLKRAFS